MLSIVFKEGRFILERSINSKFEQPENILFIDWREGKSKFDKFIEVKL